MKRGMKDAYEQRPPPDMYDHVSHDISAPAPTNGTVGSLVYRLALGSVVDVVLQNSNMLNNKSETHPWHLHGHDFWVLGHGEGKFNPAADAWRLLNVRDPIMKNTVPLHPDGWTAVRFRRTTWVWLFHCHVEAMCSWAWVWSSRRVSKGSAVAIAHHGLWSIKGAALIGFGPGASYHHFIYLLCKTLRSIDA
ncbi:hypothetical protein ZWY2020_010428 [Hordeum vulgare]|nr:hypothetical protein ZWY2020_010428 [Hordeum vulgare]